ncbi:MAG: hypothetical protein PHN64_03900 [Desulfovibrionaceae bacterium]|nr:hypothetical protein [Desulfovibrionaceae bacterium]
MNTDIRLSVEFFDHPKVVKLKRRLGLEGVFALQMLWVWAAQSRPDGVLSGMDEEDIEIAARWDGEEGRLLEALVSLRFIDSEGGEYILHGWEEHQAYASKAEERRSKAKAAADARWGNAKKETQGESSNAKECSELCSEHATSMPQASLSNAPEPEPEQEEKTREREKTCARVEPSPLPEEQAEPWPQDSPQRTDSPSKGNGQHGAFKSCFAVYPVQQGEEDAWREWCRLSKNGTLAECSVVYDAILLLAAEDERWRDGFVPAMAKWLRGKGWNDKPYAKPAAQERASPAAVGGCTALPAAKTEWQKNKQEQRNMAALVLSTGGINGQEKLDSSATCRLEHDVRHELHARRGAVAGRRVG